MAESHSEDSPLLGATDPPSPGESSPAPRGIAPSWQRPYHQHDGSPSIWSPSVPRVPSESLHVPVGGGVIPKLVHSQTSMDSGCECDPSDADNPQPPSSHRNERNSGGFSPLSPSQPGSSTEPPSPGPSGCIAPLAQKESLDCHCSALDDRCVCDSSPPCAIVDTGGERTILTHTDRGELQNVPCKVTFRIEGYEDDLDEATDERLAFNSSNSNGMESASQSGSEPGEEFRELVKAASRPFPMVASYSKTGMLSASSSTASMPMCRICHFPQGEGLDTLISPCRCSGTMQFIHESCLMKWLEISSKRTKKTATCELCNYQFNRHKKFRLRHWQLPTCSRLDKALHSVFLLCLIIMAACATVTIYCFKQDRFVKKREDTDLTKSEIVTLTCGVLFFVAFFMAMYVEVKAKDTLYRLFSRFLYLNQTWHIDEYDKRRDNLHAPV